MGTPVTNVSKKANGNKKIIIFGAAIVIIVMGVVIYYLLTRGNDTDFAYDNNATVGLMPGVDRDALLAEMQESVDKSAIAFSINSNPTVENSKMNICFENPKGNEKDVIIELFDNETGESIYKSNALKEGSFLTEVTISKKFKPGEYGVTAYITAYELETHNTIGQAAAQLNIVVL